MVAAVEIHEGSSLVAEDLLSPDVELDVSELIDGRVYRGREGVRAYWESLLADVFAELTMETEATEDRGEVVIVPVRIHAVGKRSGVPVDVRAAWVATVEDGLVTSARLTLDPERALDAAPPVVSLA
jgi:ketosteroid isomerase-like protein